MNRESRAKAALDWVLIAAFLLGIAAPSVRMIAGHHDEPSSTAEASTPLPPWPHRTADAIEFAGKFKKWFSERFGFRQELVRWHGLLSLKLFRASSSARVLVGKKGWLFLVEAPGAELRWATPLPRKNLNAWVSGLERWNDELSEHGIHFVCVFPPDKQTMVPEALPGWVPRSKASPAIELAAVLSARGHVAVADVRRAVLGGKGREPLYYKTDSHWSGYGGFLGWRSVGATLARWYPTADAASPDEVRVERFQGSGGDLARFLGLQKELEEQIVLARPQRRARVVGEGDLDELPPLRIRSTFCTERSGAPIRRAVIFRDSFFTAMLPHAAETFDHAVYVWSTNMDVNLVAREAPDVVIYEIVERSLRDHAPRESGNWSDAARVSAPVDQDVGGDAIEPSE